MKPIQFICCVILTVAVITESYAQKLNLLIGTYTKPGKSEGIYVYEFDATTGKAVYKNEVAVTSPSYLALSTNQNLVYSVNEAMSRKSTVSAFQFDKNSGALTLLNQVSSNGDGPSYVSTDKDGKHAFIANYSGGSFAVLPILPNGSLDNASQVIQYESNGIGKGQQAKPHPHSTVLSPDDNFLYVSDLGNDEILAYQYTPTAAKPLTLTQTIKLPAGSGPRHLTFHPNKKFAYSVQELSGDVFAYTYKKGKLSYLQNISGLPQGYTGRRWAADIHVSPDGKFLYSSNRSDANDIAIFSIQKSGKLISVGRQSTLGKAPRNFVIDPTGNYLLAANQDSDTVIIFKRDKKTGLLSDTGEKLNIGSPVCLKFAEL